MSPHEIAPPALAAGVVLVAAWIVVIDQSKAMCGRAPGLGSPSFFLVLLHAGTTLPVLSVIPFLPAALARKTDRATGKNG